MLMGQVNSFVCSLSFYLTAALSLSLALALPHSVFLLSLLYMVVSLSYPPLALMGAVLVD